MNTIIVYSVLRASRMDVAQCEIEEYVRRLSFARRYGMSIGEALGAANTSGIPAGADGRRDARSDSGALHETARVSNRR